MSFSVDADGVVGGTEEFDLRLAVHTTDNTQRMSVSKGRAIDIVPLKVSTTKGSDSRPTYVSSHPVVFSPPSIDLSSQTKEEFYGDATDENERLMRKAIFPINDPMAELCVALYASSRFDGVSNREVPREHDPVDFTRGLGQVFIPWHAIIRHLVQDGVASVDGVKRHWDDRETVGQFLFPTTTVKQEFSSLVTRDGIAYRVEILKSQKKDTLAFELEKLDAKALAHKATLYVHVGMMTGKLPLLPGEKRRKHNLVELTLRERIDIISDFMINNQPNKKAGHKHGLDRFVEACQRYDKETDRQTRLFVKAMEAYGKQYEQLWAVDSYSKERLLTLPDRVQSNGSVLKFRPDVPSMMRFHLPTWAVGEERIPFVQLWFGTMPGMAKHLHEPTVYTEHWLLQLLRKGTKLAHITEDAFIEAVARITYDVHKTSPDHLDRAAIKGTVEHNQLVRVIEALSYTVSAVAHAARYQGDVATANKALMDKLIKKHDWLKDERVQADMFRYDTEDGQTGITAGTESAGDCEGVEYVIATIENLMIQGRINGDSRAGGGRGWSMPLLVAAHCMLSMLADFNHYGAVNGAQLSDAKDRGNEEGFVGSDIDTKGGIAGHTYSFGKPLAVLEAQYEKHKDFIMRAVGVDLAAILRAHIEQVYAPWVRGNLDTLARVRKVLRSLPAHVNEGTGRQEPLLLPPEYYYGKSEELLKRTASHASELELLRVWPSTGSKRTSKANASNDRSSNTSVPSLGEAMPYMFQQRLLVDSRFGIDPHSQCRLERHLSPFYRRMAHAASTKLKRINPIFDHMIWVSVPRMTYGPVLREVLDPDGDALPLPMPESLHKAYSGTPELCDILAQRMRRLLPPDFSFVHVKTDIDAAKLKNIGGGQELSSSQTVTAGSSLFFHPQHQHQGEALATFTLPRTPSSDFFEHSLCSWKHPSHSEDDAQLTLSHTPARGFVKGDVLSTGNFSGEADDNVHTVYISSESALATVLSAQGNTTNRWETLAPGRINVRYTDDEQATRLKDLIASSKGVTQVEIVCERLRDNLPDMLSAYFTRRVAFVIDDAKATSLTASAPKSNSQTFDVRSEGKHHKRHHHHHHHHRHRQQLTSMAELTTARVSEIAQTIGVDTNVIPIGRLKRGIEVELEHGDRTFSKDSRLDVTHSDLIATARIALAHFRENPGLRDPDSGAYLIPDYYHLLDEMEERQDEMWSERLSSKVNEEKPSVFLTPEQRVSVSPSDASLVLLPRYTPTSAQRFPTVLNTDS